jgi:CheY-like chemotaxis protein
MAATPHAGRGVLVVEDDPDIQQVLRFALEMAGYPVATADNGVEAIRQLQAGAPPCLILLDLMMPVMDGWQFRAEQQRDPALAAIPVVVISADGRVPQKAASLGAAGYMRKPVDFDRLVEVVRRYC